MYSPVAPAVGDLSNAEAKDLAAAQPVAEIAVLAPVPGPYTYAIPKELVGRLERGTRVLVPLGGQSAIEGVVLDIANQSTAMATGGKMPTRLRPIRQLIEGPPLPAELLSLVRFVAEYYLAPIGEALRLALPPHQQAERELSIALTEPGQALGRQIALEAPLLPPAAAALTPNQQTVLSALSTLLLPPSTSRRQGIRLLALKRALSARPIRDLISTLQSLASAKLVEIHETLRSRVPQKQENWISVRTAETDEAEAAAAAVERFLGRSATRAALWRHLLRFGPLPLSDLRELSPRAPALVKQLQKAGLVEVSPRSVQRDPFADANDESAFALSADATQAASTPPKLTVEQQNALAPMLAALSGGYQGFLLHGVTGSGKTELYLRLIEEALLRGKSALVLVPEIALTPQLAARFVARFGPKVAVLHSGLTPGQRADAWRRILHQREEGCIALGPRSALFAPLGSLGVVIVDEEHDASFKQQDGVRYHGRDVALLRAQRAGAVAVLGSATPSLEALALSQRGKLSLLTLSKRATGLPLPKVTVIDLKQHILPEDQALLASPLEKALAETLGAGEQALLFLNRRGYATFLLCKSCGHRLECRHCAVTLTWHKARERLLCHYCGYSEAPTEICPVCNAAAVTRLGLGTEKLVEQITARFPAARVARLDRDTSTQLGPLLSAMHRREIDILIGTQMLAKGHDFPGVTLVGVVLADTGMGLPDFRAGERTFQLLAQVAGRAGRQERPGRVLIQTFNPDHPAVQCAVEHDYARFAEAELAAREALGYAPAMRIGLLRIDGPDPLQVRKSAEAVAERLRQEITRLHLPVQAQGPAEAPLSRLKGRTRWQIMVRAPSSQMLRTTLWAALNTTAVQSRRGVRISADVDPTSTL